MVEQGDPIERRGEYRTLIAAFAIWAVHFTICYGAVLVFPEQPIARWIAIAAMIAAAGTLIGWGLRLGKPRSPFALGALGLAMSGVVFGTFPAFVG